MKFKLFLEEGKDKVNLIYLNHDRVIAKIIDKLQVSYEFDVYHLPEDSDSDDEVAVRCLRVDKERIKNLLSGLDFVGEERQSERVNKARRLVQQ
jgi:hypothetical protein